MSEDVIGSIPPAAPRNPRDIIIELIEQELNRGNGTWTVGLDIDVATMHIVAVATRYLGKSKFRKRWTRCSFGARMPSDKAAELGMEGTAAKFAETFRKQYTEYANQPHWGFNIFRKKRRGY